MITHCTTTSTINSTISNSNRTTTVIKAVLVAMVTSIEGPVGVMMTSVVVTCISFVVVIATVGLVLLVGMMNGTVELIMITGSVLLKEALVVTAMDSEVGLACVVAVDKHVHVHIAIMDLIDMHEKQQDQQK